jgi:hypothetical protein
MTTLLRHSDNVGYELYMTVTETFVGPLLPHSTKSQRETECSKEPENLQNAKITTYKH